MAKIKIFFRDPSLLVVVVSLILVVALIVSLTFKVLDLTRTSVLFFGGGAIESVPEYSPTPVCGGLVVHPLFIAVTVIFCSATVFGILFLLIRIGPVFNTLISTFLVLLVFVGLVDELTRVAAEAVNTMAMQGGGFTLMRSVWTDLELEGLGLHFWTELTGGGVGGNPLPVLGGGEIHLLLESPTPITAPEELYARLVYLDTLFDGGLVSSSIRDEELGRLGWSSLVPPSVGNDGSSWVGYITSTVGGWLTIPSLSTAFGFLVVTSAVVLIALNVMSGWVDPTLLAVAEAGAGGSDPISQVNLYIASLQPLLEFLVTSLERSALINHPITSAVANLPLPNDPVPNVLLVMGLGGDSLSRVIEYLAALRPLLESLMPVLGSVGVDSSVATMMVAGLPFHLTNNLDMVPVIVGGNQLVQVANYLLVLQPVLEFMGQVLMDSGVVSGAFVEAVNGLPLPLFVDPVGAIPVMPAVEVPVPPLIFPQPPFIFDPAMEVAMAA